MNRLLLFILLSFSSDLVSSQPVKENKRIGLNLPFFITSAGVGDYDEQYLFNPQIGIRKNKSMYYVGPSISLHSGFTGGIFSYQIFPNGTGNRFDFFFQANVCYETTKYNDYNGFYWGDNTTRETKSSLLIGYGFHLNTGDQFFITTNFGFGICSQTRKIVYNNSNYNRNLSEIKPGVEISLGIGFNFRKH